MRCLWLYSMERRKKPCLLCWSYRTLQSPGTHSYALRTSDLLICWTDCYRIAGGFVRASGRARLHTLEAGSIDQNPARGEPHQPTAHHNTNALIRAGRRTFGAPARTEFVAPYRINYIKFRRPLLLISTHLHSLFLKHVFKRALFWITYLRYAKMREKYF
jgi:hypothetical protein